MYDWCMARTNIDIDDDACGRVMSQYGLRTKREAVNLALRSLDAEPIGLNEEPSRIRGMGLLGSVGSG